MFSMSTILFNGIPDDPRFSKVPFPTKQDVADLANNKFLTSSLIEWVIHHTWFLMSEDMTLHPRFYVAPIWFPRRIESILRNATSSIVADQARFNSMKLRYEFLKKGEHTIVLPHFKNSHFTVVKIVLCLEGEKIFKEISCFDSLNRVRKIRKSHGVGPTLQLLEQFLDYVVLWDVEVPKSRFNTFDIATSIPCPPQKNGYDCGLFTAVVVAYVVGGKEINTTTFSQTQVSVLRKHMVNEFQVEDGKVVFDPDSFKYWFPGMEMNYTMLGQPARKATTNQRFARNYDRDGNELFPADDILHLMDEYTLAIREEEEFVAEWEEGLEGENELDEANEEDAEDEVQITGTKLATKPNSASSSPVKVLKVQPAPKIPAPIVEHDKSKAAPRSIVVVDDDDQDPIQIDELRTLEEKLNKARYEFERSQQVLDAYKKQQKGLSEREEQEQEQEQEVEEQEEEDLEEQQEEEETQQPKQDLQFIKHGIGFCYI